MMKKISDERLDKMLTAYCEADCEQTFTYDPEKKREKIVPFVHYRKQLIAAASLVLVSVLSLILYFSFGNINNTPLTVAPFSQKTITPSSTEGGGGGDPDRQDNTAPTESKSFLQRIHDFFFPDDAEDASNGTSPTEKGSASADNPSLRRNPSTIPSATQPSDPPIDDPPKATEAGDPTPITETPTEPDDPPYVPPTIPMDPPWYDPEPTDPPDEGDEPGFSVPTEGGGMIPLPPPEIYARFDSLLMAEATDVYCKVYSRSGLIGSTDLYDRSHEAAILGIAPLYTDVLYRVPDGLINTPGDYTFIFYDQNGNELARVQEYCE